MQKYKVSNADLWCDAYLKQNKQTKNKNNQQFYPYVASPKSWWYSSH